MESEIIPFGIKVGSIIAEVRNDRHMTQAQMAKLLHVCTTTYSHYEQVRTVPSLETIVKIGEIFGVPVEYLIGNSDCNVEYKRFKEKFSDKYSYGDAINHLFSFNAKDRQHISYEIELINYKNIKGSVNKLP